MRVTVLELPAAWGHPERALAEVDARLARGPATDLVLLPEQSLSGYVSPTGDFDLTPFAEPPDGPTARACAALATAREIHLVAPLVLREGDALYNAMTCYAPDGTQLFCYRKRHPWIPETWATAGPTAPPVITIAGCATTIAICYDVHFLADDTARELAAAQLLLFPSAWVEEVDTRVAKLVELAQQFDLHIANANWAPGVVRIPGQGASCIVRPDGTVVAAPAGGRADLTL